MRLLNVPAKLDDNTSNLQAVSKLISEKLNPSTIAALQNSNNLDNVERKSFDYKRFSLNFIRYSFYFKAKQNTASTGDY